MHVTVDLTRCQGYGNCVSAAPAVFDLGENGLVVLLDEEPPPEEWEAARRAEKLCPVTAIEVRESP